MLWNLVADPLVDVLDKFNSAAINFNNEAGIADLRTAYMQVSERMRGSQQFAILETTPLKCAQ